MCILGTCLALRLYILTVHADSNPWPWHYKHHALTWKCVQSYIYLNYFLKLTKRPLLMELVN